MRLAIALALTTMLTGCNTPKPEVKWSKATPIIREYVEKMAADVKDSTGVEMTEEQKGHLVESIKANMEAQHIYAFIDP